MELKVESGHQAFGFVGQIPIRSLWLLMLYASDMFRHQEQAKVDLESDVDNLPEIIAEILAYAVKKRQRRQLSLGYRTTEAALPRVRGKIKVLNTERHHLLSRGLIACQFNDLTIDINRNRFVRAALERASRLVKSDRTLSRRCRSLANDMKLMGVSGNVPTRAQISVEQFGRHDSDDQFMVAAAKLINDFAIPTELLGDNVLLSPERKKRWVQKLFEKAVGGFCNVVLSQDGWQVYTGKRLSWNIDWKTPGIDSVLPGMQTDIVLVHKEMNRKIVIDTKFTSILKPGQFNNETLNSAYIYQIYSYLMSQVGQGNPLADRAEGVLLHPTVGEHVDETVVIQNHPIRFLTVDLTAPTQDIRKQLMKLIEKIPPPTS